MAATSLLPCDPQRLHTHILRSEGAAYAYTKYEASLRCLRVRHCNCIALLRTPQLLAPSLVEAASSLASTYPRLLCSLRIPVASEVPCCCRLLRRHGDASAASEVTPKPCTSSYGRSMATST